MAKQTISVIIPAYNSEEYIQRCVESALNQSYREIEVIVVNDGSTDDTEWICKGIAASDDRLRIISVKNGGPARARNIGLQQSKGNWIMFVDSDDALKKDACRRLMDAAEQTGADLIFGNLVNIYPEKEVPLLPFQGDFREFTGEAKKWLERSLVSKISETGDLMLSLSGPFCKLIRKSTVDGVWFPEDISFGEDTCFCLDIIAKAERVVYISDCIYCRFCRDDSLSMAGNNAANRLIRYTNWVIDRYYTRSYFQWAVKELIGKNLLWVITEYLVLRHGNIMDLVQQVENYRSSQKVRLTFRDIAKLSLTVKGKILLGLNKLHLDWIIYVMGGIRNIMLSVRKR